MFDWSVSAGNKLTKVLLMSVCTYMCNKITCANCFGSRPHPSCTDPHLHLKNWTLTDQNVSLRCAEHHRKYTKCQDEITLSVKRAENSLSGFISQKVTCLADCTDQQANLKVSIFKVKVMSESEKSKEFKKDTPR